MINKIITMMIIIMKMAENQLLWHDQVSWPVVNEEKRSSKKNYKDSGKVILNSVKVSVLDKNEGSKYEFCDVTTSSVKIWQI